MAQKEIIDLETGESEEIEGIDTKELKKLWDRIDYKDMMLILFLLLMFIMYLYHTKEIAACNNYFNDLLMNKSISQFPLMYG